MKKSINKFALILLMFFCVSSKIYAIEDTNNTDDKTTQSTTINITVPPTISTYSVNIPEGIYMGSISSAADINYKYDVNFSVDNENGSVIVSSDKTVDLILEGSGKKTNNNSITCYNTFDTYEFTKNSSAQGNILIKKEDIAKVPQGRYVGSLNFYIKYQDNMKPTPNPTPISPNPTPNPNPTPTPKPNPPLSPIPPQPNNPSITEGSYICDVSMRQGSDFSTESMCNKLFYKKADIVYKDGNATLTLYVIDPIPNYASYGTPLSNINFSYNGSTYSASLNNSAKVAKSFDVAQGFIPEAGNYYTSLVTVTLPVKAIEESVNGKLTCSAHIDAVMNITQSFYVVLSNLQKGQTPNESQVNKIDSSKKANSNSSKFKSNKPSQKDNNKLSSKFTPKKSNNKTNSDITTNANKPTEIMGYVLKTNSLWKMAGFIILTLAICLSGAGYVLYKNGKFKKW